MLLHQSFDLFRPHLFRQQVSTMCQVQLFIRQQPSPSKVRGADNGSNRCEACKTTTIIEEIALRMEKALGIEAYPHMLLAQKSDQALNKSQRLFVKRRRRQLANQPLNRLSPNLTQTQVCSSLWLITQQQTEITQPIQPIAH